MDAKAFEACSSKWRKDGRIQLRSESLTLLTARINPRDFESQMA
jgi:hypothetical protein